MLPSFRLVVMTFLCGFAAVYGGLHMAVSFHGALPVTAAHAGSHVLPATDSEMRVAAMPAMFKTRFAISPAPAVIVRTPSALERPSQPASITPDAPAAGPVPLTTAEVAEQPSEPTNLPAADQSPNPSDSILSTDAGFPLADAPSLADPRQ